jgi:hypothetical protein
MAAVGPPAVGTPAVGTPAQQAPRASATNGNGFDKKAEAARLAATTCVTDCVNKAITSLVDAHKADVAAAAAQVNRTAELLARVRALEADKSDLTKKNNDAATQLAATSADLTKCKSELAQVGTCPAELAKVRAELNAAQTQVAQIQTQPAANCADLEKLSAALLAAQQALTAAQKSVENCPAPRSTPPQGPARATPNPQPRAPGAPTVGGLGQGQRGRPSSSTKTAPKPTAPKTAATVRRGGVAGRSDAQAQTQYAQPAPVPMYYVPDFTQYGQSLLF